jgi:nitrogen fixation/metabolism regulation signal transduction histidine kinase
VFGNLQIILFDKRREQSHPNPYVSIITVGLKKVRTTCGFDEIAYLSQKINEMIDDIRVAKEKLELFGEKLNSEEKKIITILDSIPDSLLVIDKKGIIKVANKTFKDTFK